MYERRKKKARRRSRGIYIREGEPRNVKRSIPNTNLGYRITSAYYCPTSFSMHYLLAWFSLTASSRPVLNYWVLPPPPHRIPSILRVPKYEISLIPHAHGIPTGNPINSKEPTSVTHSCKNFPYETQPHHKPESWAQTHSRGVGTQLKIGPPRRKKINYLEPLKFQHGTVL